MRKFNYTGRRPLDRSGIVIRLEVDEETGARFHVDQLELQPEVAASENSVYVEAYYSNLFHREDVGTGDQLQVGGWRQLPGFPPSRQIKFRIKVVDETRAHGLIVADERGLKPLVPQSEEERTVLLDFQYADSLGQRVWDLHFAPQAYPVFWVNRRLQEYHLRQYLTSDPGFVCLVYPDVVRRVLEHYLVGPGSEDDDSVEDGSSPRTDWLEFARILTGSDVPGYQATVEDRREWIMDATDAFARRMELLGKYARALESEQ